MEVFGQSSSNSQGVHVPKLRFPGFEGEWETKRLDRIADINPPATYIPDRFYYIDLESVTSGRLTSLKTVEKMDAPSRAQRLVLQGDILYQTVRPYQKNNYLVPEKLDLPTVASTGYAQIRTKFNSQFLYSALHAVRFLKEVLLRCTGSNYPAINSNDLREIEVHFPGCEEQNKIAAFLSLIDQRIEKQRQLVEALKSYKRGALSKLFPQKGETAPKYRFYGFSEPWEQWKVCDIAESTYGGGTPDTTNEKYWIGDIPWIQSSDLTEHQLYGVNPKKHISMSGLNASAAKLVPQDSIAVITRVGVGKLAVMPFSYATSQDFLSLSKLKTDIWFSAYVLYNKLQSELNAVQGTSIKGITKDELLTKSIYIPERNEQRVIGVFFRNLDNLVSLHQRKLDELQEIKSALLQHLFI